jgi:hypothetical protein
MANVGVMGLRPWRSRFVFLFNFAVVFDFKLFPVPASKAKSIGNVITNRQNAATWYLFFSILQYALLIDAPNHPALRCAVNRKKIREIKLENYISSKFRPCFLLAQGASLSPSITQKTNSNQRRIICCVLLIHGEIV